MTDVKFLVGVDDRDSSMNALMETLRLRHASDHVTVVNFFDDDMRSPDAATQAARRALVERFEVQLIPRLGHALWTVEQVGLLDGKTVRDGLADMAIHGRYDFLVAGVCSRTQHRACSAFRVRGTGVATCVVVGLCLRPPCICVHEGCGWRGELSRIHRHRRS
jgi:hypothetical protein